MFNNKDSQNKTQAKKQAFSPSVSQAAMMDETHNKNQYDAADNTKKLKRGYENADEFYRQKTFAERFFQYLPLIKGVKGFFHFISGLTLIGGGAFCIWHLFFASEDFTSFVVWAKFISALAFFPVFVVLVEVVKGRSLKEWSKNHFQSLNAKKGEKRKFTPVALAIICSLISLIGSVGFTVGSVYFASNNNYKLEQQKAVELKEIEKEYKANKEQLTATFNDSRKIKQDQIAQLKVNIVESCEYCYTKREEMQAAITRLNNELLSLSTEKIEALKPIDKARETQVEKLDIKYDKLIDGDSKESFSEAYIFGGVVFASEILIIVFAFLFAWIMHRGKGEGKDVLLLSPDQQEEISLEAILVNNMKAQQSRYLELMQSQLLLAGANDGQLFLPTNQTPTAVVIERKKKRKKKKKKKGTNEVEETAKNPIGYNHIPKGETDIKIEAKKYAPNGKNSPNFDDSTKNEKGQKEGQNLGSNSSNSSKNFLMNLNPETPYNLSKKYDVSASEKKKLNELRKAYMNFVKRENKRPLLSELATVTNKSPNTVKKYISMMEKDGQKLLRQRGEMM